MKLTDLALRSLPFETGQRDYPDDAVRGLTIRVGARTKTFMLVTRHDDRRSRLKIGTYPEWTLREARERARDLLAEARVRTTEEPAALTFGKALDRFYQLHVPSMRPGSQQQCTRILTRQFSSLAKRPLPGLKTSELAALLDRINAPAEKRNAFVWLRTFLNWCYQRGYLDQNPIARVKGMGASKQRDRVLSADELTAVWQASYQHHSADYGALIRLLILSAQRKGQWLAFEPSFIDGDAVIFPASVMKAARVHLLPLTDAMRREIGNRLTFGKWTTSYNKRALDRLSDITGYCLHDLRRSAATHMAEAGTPPHVIERILAHQSGVVSGVAARYNRASYMPEMRAALEKWEQRLASLLSGA